MWERTPSWLCEPIEETVGALAELVTTAAKQYSELLASYAA